MKKIVRLTESELKNIVEASVKRTINEGLITEEILNENSFAKKLALYLGLPFATVAAALATIGTDNPVSRGLDKQYQQAQQNSQAFPEDTEERQRNTDIDSFYKDLKDDGVDTTNIKFDESRVRRAVMESIMNLMNEGKPADTQIGRHKFKAIRRDKNGNPIYTHEGGTLSDNDLKAQGWKYSKKHGLHGQISDPTKLPK